MKLSTQNIICFRFVCKWIKITKYMLGRLHTVPTCSDLQIQLSYCFNVSFYIAHKSINGILCAAYLFYWFVVSAITGTSLHLSLPWVEFLSNMHITVIRWVVLSYSLSITICLSALVGVGEIQSAWPHCWSSAHIYMLEQLARKKVFHPQCVFELWPKNCCRSLEWWGATFLTG